MFGLVLIYFIGKYFYQLAFEHDKNKWQYAILGIVVYYAGIFLAASLIGILYVVITLKDDMDKTTEMLLSLLSIPFGALACYLFYRYLANKWEKEKSTAIQEIDKIGEM